jgi:hypothetical protein
MNGVLFKVVVLIGSAMLIGMPVSPPGPMRTGRRS